MISKQFQHISRKYFYFSTFSHLFLLLYYYRSVVNVIFSDSILSLIYKAGLLNQSEVSACSGKLLMREKLQKNK